MKRPVTEVRVFTFCKSDKPFRVHVIHGTLNNSHVFSSPTDSSLDRIGYLIIHGVLVPRLIGWCNSGPFAGYSVCALCPSTVKRSPAWSQADFFEMLTDDTPPSEPCPFCGNVHTDRLCKDAQQWMLDLEGESCSSCNGTGEICSGGDVVTCAFCNGTGHFVVADK